MKSVLVAFFFACMLFHETAAFSFNDCKKATVQNEIVNGYNCNLPDDATGPGVIHSERVKGNVIWAAPRPNRHGLYEFTVEYAYFQMRAFSRRQPRIGDSVEVIVRAILYPGLVEFDQR